MKIDTSKITFKILEKTDIDLLWNWVNQKHVSKWYIVKESQKKWRDKMGAYAKENSKTKAYIIKYDGINIGYIQTYRIDSFPDYQKELEYYENACGIDLYIGEKDFIHKGIGPLMIKKFLNTIAFSLTKTNICIIGPNPENTSAIKAYSKVGFKYFKTIEKTNKEKEYIMRISMNHIEENNITIRKFKNKDTIDVAKLVTKMFKKYNSGDFFEIEGVEITLDYFDSKKYNQKQLLEKWVNSDIFYVAIENDKIIGLIRGLSNKISTLFVDDNSFNKGIGRKLVDKFEETAIKKESKYIKIRASLYAVGFYQKMGYKKTTGIRNFMGLKVYNMKKILVK